MHLCFIFIKRYCTPNAILTLSEYLLDYAPGDTAQKGWNVIEKNLSAMKDKKVEQETCCYIERIKKGERDLFF
ncbi:MAG: hypothetical protein U5N56_05395 [Candidatus Marinimicrobia bacterium]|nr:hypothetical protein [Candidatus Neomarinimicrobiota bacterium]